MTRGGHGLPKVSFGPAMPYPSTPCGRVTSEAALRLFQGWPAHKVDGLQPSSTSLDTPHCTPMHVMIKDGIILLFSLTTYLTFIHGKPEGNGAWRGVSKGVENGCKPPAL
jgi:hypothetical protein